MKAARRKNSRVTIILALKCKDSIVIASDSRTTDQEEHRDDTQKVHVVPFQDCGVLLSTSGSDDSGATIVNEMKRLARNDTLSSENKPEKALQGAVLAYRIQLVQSVYGNLTELQRAVKEMSDVRLDCDMLTAYYFEGRQRLYTSSVGLGTITPRAQSFWAMGIGKHIANYLMPKLGGVATMTTNEAIFTAIVIVDEAKQSVQGCGGPTQIGIIGPDNNPQILTPETIRSMEQQAQYLKEKQERALNDMSSNIAQAALEYVTPHPTRYQLPLED